MQRKKGSRRRFNESMVISAFSKKRRIQTFYGNEDPMESLFVYYKNKLAAVSKSNEILFFSVDVKNRQDSSSILSSEDSTITEETKQNHSDKEENNSEQKEETNDEKEENEEPINKKEENKQEIKKSIQTKETNKDEIEEKKTKIIPVNVKTEKWKLYSYGDNSNMERGDYLQVVKLENAYSIINACGVMTSNDLGHLFSYNPLCHSFIKITSDLKINYVDNFGDLPLKGISSLYFDKFEKVLYIVDSGDFYDDEKSSIFSLYNDTNIVVEHFITLESNITSLCTYKQFQDVDIYACMPKENRIVKYMRKRNNFVKNTFYHFNGCYAPIYIASNKTNFVVLCADLSNKNNSGRVIEINVDGVIVNSVKTQTSNFGGICHHEPTDIFFFTEGNKIQMY